MIDINKLTLKDVGKWVIYKDFDEEERGKLKSWNHKYIFVVYHCDNQWHRFEQFTACATDPEYLSFEESPVKEVMEAIKPKSPNAD